MNPWIARIALCRACGAGVLCGVLFWLSVSLRMAVPVAAAGSCESLTSLKLPSGTITSAKLDAESRPESCRVAATLTPSSDSEIKMEIWMPVSNWKTVRNSTLAAAPKPG